MNAEQRKRLFGNVARHMQAGNTSQEIQLRQICHCFRADPAYGMGVARALGIDLEEFWLTTPAPGITKTSSKRVPRNTTN
jgi:catalase